MRFIEGEIFDNKIEIDDSFENTVFIKCIFKDDIVLFGINSNKIIEFDGCQIEKRIFVETRNKNRNFSGIKLFFYSSKIKQFEIGKNSLLEYNWIIDINNTYIDFCSFNCCTLEDLSINDSSIDNLYMDFCIGKYHEDVDIKVNKSNIKSLSLNHISNISELSIIDSELDLLEVNECSFNYEFEISDTINKGETYIALYKSGNLIIKNSFFEKNFKCEYILPDNQEESVGNILLKDNMFRSKAELSNGVIDRLDIFCSSKTQGEISFVNFKILDVLTLSGLNKHADFQFLHLNVCLFSCMNFLNYGSVSILGLTCYKGKNPGFLIAGPSNIGNMNIQGSDLSSFPLISFLDCSLFGLKYSNVKWFDPKILNLNNSETSDFWVKKQESYRQLKYCAEDNKDKIQALIFKAYEIDAYQHTLNWKKDFPDLLMLWLNKISNNHGLSWSRGLLFTILCGLLFYLIFYVCYDDLSYRMYFWGNFIKYIWLFNGIDDLIQFLKLPSHTLGDSLIRLLGSICYIIGKILVAYGIFQTISAFRKYVKVD